MMLGLQISSLTQAHMVNHPGQKHIKRLFQYWGFCRTNQNLLPIMAFLSLLVIRQSVARVRGETLYRDFNYALKKPITVS